jgi:transposase-like protein
MNPQGVFCANPACADRGAVDKGNLRVHSLKEQRFRCATCRKTFAASKGTPCYRLHKADDLFVQVITLLAHGCPTPATVAAFALDERTVAGWQAKAGTHCQHVQHHFLNTRPIDLGHVQADELYAKRQGGRSWMAMAMAVPSRLWIGGVLSPQRNLLLIQQLVNLVFLLWLPGTPLLICVDGLVSYVSAFWKAFRVKHYRGGPGRPPYRLPDGIWLAQVMKTYSGRRLTEVVRRVLWGSEGQVLGKLRETKTGEQINTSYIERLNATFRACLAGLTRRGRRLVKDEEVLVHGMYTGGLCVQLLSPAPQPAGPADPGQEVAPTHPSHGCWMGRPCLVHPRTPILPGASRLNGVLPHARFPGDHPRPSPVPSTGASPTTLPLAPCMTALPARPRPFANGQDGAAGGRAAWGPAKEVVGRLAQSAGDPGLLVEGAGLWWVWGSPSPRSSGLALVGLTLGEPNLQGSS